MAETKAVATPLDRATPRPWRITSDAGHPANIRITATSRRHIAKVYAESLERDPICEANAVLIVQAVNEYAANTERIARLEEALREIRSECGKVSGSLNKPMSALAARCEKIARAALKEEE